MHEPFKHKTTGEVPLKILTGSLMVQISIGFDKHLKTFIMLRRLATDTIHNSIAPQAVNLINVFWIYQTDKQYQIKIVQEWSGFQLLLQDHNNWTNYQSEYYQAILIIIKTFMEMERFQTVVMIKNSTKNFLFFFNSISAMSNANNSAFPWSLCTF